MAADISSSIDQAMGNPNQPDKQISNFGLSEAKMHRFGGILRSLNLEAIPAFASKVRQSGYPTTGIISKSSGIPDLIPCKTIGSPLCGSFHIVFTLEFNDGVKWMLKIPANGHRFDSVAAAALVSEARTMQLLKNETTIPVPAVYAFDATPSNDLNTPFILMERIDGKPLWQGWYDDEIPKARLEHFRIKALQSLAEAMAQLNKFTLNQGGALEFDATGKPVGLRGAKIVDAVATYYQGMGVEDVSNSNQNSATSHNHHDGHDEGRSDLHGNNNSQNTDNKGTVDGKDEKTEKHDKDQLDDEDDEDIICEKGPFDCPKSAILFDVDRSDVYRKEDRYTQGCYKALRVFIDLAFANFEDPGRRFVLNHPDLDVQNVLVADDGTLRGLIDVSYLFVHIIPFFIMSRGPETSSASCPHVLFWKRNTDAEVIQWDGVASVPREVGCAQYPLWLMRDWVPYYYIYDEQEGKTEEDADYEESSPAELTNYRAIYAHFMEKAIERQTGGPDRSTTFGTLPKQEAQLTRRSLVMRDLNLAGSSPFLTTNVMCHILNQIEQVTEADWGDMNYDLVGVDFDPADCSEGAVDSDADIISTINNESEGQDQQDTEVDVVETHGSISRRVAAGADETILEPVVSRAMAGATETPSVTQQLGHESQTLSKACKPEASTMEVAQSSNTELKAQTSLTSAPLGWGRRLLCFGCNTAEKALKRVAKIGHILVDGIEEVAEVLAEVEVHHQDSTDNYNKGKPRKSSDLLGRRHLSIVEASDVTRTERPEVRQSVQGMVEPEQPQNITSVQTTAEYQDTPAAQGMIDSNNPDETTATIQPVLIQDIPARKAKLIETLKAKKIDHYRFDKAAIKEELKIWEQIALMVWVRGITLEQLQTNQAKIAHWVIDTLKAEEKQEKDLVEESPLPSAPNPAEQGAMESEEERKTSSPTSFTPQEQSGLVLAPRSRTSKQKRVRKGKNRPVPASGAMLSPDLGTENLSFSKSCSQTALHEDPVTVNRLGIRSNGDQMVGGMIHGQKDPCLDDQEVGTPLELVPSPSSQPRPIAEELLQRAISSENLKAIYSFGTSCMRKIFPNGNKFDNHKGSLRSNSSATYSKNGDNNGSDTGKSCKSSVTSLSDKEIEFDKKVNPKQNQDDVFETAVTHTARNHNGERGKNSNDDVCDEIEMSEAMETIAPPILPTSSGALNTEEASNKPWLPGRMYDPCRGEWVDLKETRQAAKIGLEEGRGGETKSAEDIGHGPFPQIEKRLDAGEKDGLENKNETDAENEEQDENDIASLCNLGNAEEDFFEDDGEFRSRNIFTLLGMGRLDDIRLLRMQEGFLKLLVEF